MFNKHVNNRGLKVSGRNPGLDPGCPESWSQRPFPQTWSWMKYRSGVRGQEGPYLSPSLCVVLIHSTERVPATARRHVLHCVLHEPPAEPGSILDLVRTAPPMPALHRHREAPGRGGSGVLKSGVAAALRHIALTAGASDGVHESSRHNGVDESRFFGPFKIKQTSSSLHAADFTSCLL